MKKSTANIIAYYALVGFIAALVGFNIWLCRAQSSALERFDNAAAVKALASDVVKDGYFEGEEETRL